MRALVPARGRADTEPGGGHGPSGPLHGIRYEYGTYGLAAGAFVLPYAAAAAAIAASETAVGGVVITAFRSVGTQLVKQLTWRAFSTKVGSSRLVGIRLTTRLPSRTASSRLRPTVGAGGPGPTRPTSNSPARSLRIPPVRRLRPNSGPKRRQNRLIQFRPVGVGNQVGQPILSANF